MKFQRKVGKEARKERIKRGVNSVLLVVMPEYTGVWHNDVGRWWLFAYFTHMKIKRTMVYIVEVGFVRLSAFSLVAKE